VTSASIWIVLPGFVAGILYFLRRWKSAVAIAGTVLALMLSLLTLTIHFEELISFGPWYFKIAERLPIAGRALVLQNTDRPMLALIYLAAAFWFGGTRAARVHQLFVPLGLAMVVFLTAALAVEPYLYAALLIEVAVLISVPILSPPGKPIARGVIRFLAFQSLGVPFILLAGRFLTGIDTDTLDEQTILRAVILLGFGFAFLLAIFPLNTWIPLLAEEAHPYSAAFVFSTIPGVVTLFALSFLDRYPWLLQLDVLQFVGVLMVATGGLWAAFQRHLGRLLGYAVIIGIGQSILAIGVPDGLDLHFALMLPRLLALGVWALALSELSRHAPDLSFRSVQGMARHFHFAGVGVILASFSYVGLPLLAGFPTYLVLWSRLWQLSPHATIWVLLGYLGLMIGSLRTLAVLVMGPEELPWKDKENWLSRVYLLLALLGLFILGIFPHWFLPLLMNLSSAF
jgi:NADH-quinone oxidoreductase subunit N